MGDKGLKGAAGTLEIRAVAEAAGQTEDALAAGNLTEIDRLIDRLEQAILPALAASAALKGTSAPVTAGVAAGADYTASMPMIMEFRELLLRRSLRARKTFDLLEQTLGMMPKATGLDSVKAALGRLDYDEALIMLDKITVRNELPSVRTQPAEIVL